jgi:hypothetical protein
MKMVTYIKGTYTIGTLGMGFVQLKPNASSDIVCSYVSGAAFAGTVTSLVAGGVSSVANAQSIFLNAAFKGAGGGATIEQRLVLAGIRSRYIGTELNRGGRTVSYTNPSHETTDGDAITAPLAIPGLSSTPVTQAWDEIRWTPMMPWEMGYSIHSYPSDNAGVADNKPQICVITHSTAGNVFEYEAVQYHELIGTNFGLTDTYASTFAPSVVSASNGYGRLVARNGKLVQELAVKSPSTLEGLGGMRGMPQFLKEKAVSAGKAAAGRLSKAAIDHLARSVVSPDDFGYVPGDMPNFLN